MSYMQNKFSLSWRDIKRAEARADTIEIAKAFIGLILFLAVVVFVGAVLQGNIPAWSGEGVK